MGNRGDTLQLNIHVQRAILRRNQEIDRLLHRAELAEHKLTRLRLMVAAQAGDSGLWFNAETAPEAYLQQELRKLHAAIESK